MKKKITISLLLILLSIPKICRADVNLWPFFETTEDSTTVLYPFYVHEGDFLMAFPLVYRTNQGADYHYLWPLMKISRGKIKRAAPIWFSKNEEEFTLFPIIHQTQEYTIMSIPPTYMRKDGEFKAVFPLYAKTRNMLVAFPTFYKMTDQGQTTKLGFWPVFYHSKEGDSESLWWMPYYQKRSNTKNISLLFPVYSKWEGPDRKGLWLLPYYHEKTPTRAETSVLGLYGQRENETSETHESNKLFWAFGYDKLSLYVRDEKISKTGDLLERERRFLIFSDQWKWTGRRTFRILGVPIMERIS